MKYSLSEILDACSKLGSTKEKVTFLQHYDTLTLRLVLQYALDYRIEWLLPHGIPPYKPCEYLDQHARLFQETRKLNLFVKGGDHPDMHTIKREQLFIQFLEGLDPEDAAMMCSIKDKKVPFNGINASLVNAAFPGLIETRSKKQSDQSET